MKTSNFSFLAALAIAAVALPMLGCEGNVGTSPTGGPGPVVCSASQIKCGTQCVNATSDPQNCGACGTVCLMGQMCQNGSCQCQAGLMNCNGACVSSDSSHCGGCTNVCPLGQVCNGGTCATSCAPGVTMCPSGTC